MTEEQIYDIMDSLHPDTFGSEELAEVRYALENVKRLQRDSDILCALQAHGVDNWDGYGEALQSLDQL